jgi:F420-dependent oxidoreductase-like protein
MKLRVFTEPQQGATDAQLIRVARHSEDLGFEAFFRSDHLLAMGDGDGGAGPTDSWISLAVIAAATSRIRLGTLVTSATFRLPGPLAIAVAQVDVISGGRIEFGLGSGWFEAEHSAYGVPFPSLGERFDRLEEQLAIVTGLWRTPVGSRFDFTGKHYRLTDSPALPKPFQAGGPPIIVGGGGPKRTPALAARFADEFNVPFRPFDEMTAQLDRVRAACVEIGRATPPLFSAALVVCCGRTDAEIAGRAASIGRSVDDLRENGLCGTPEQVAEKIAGLAEVGVERTYIQVLDLDDLDHLDLIASAVVPLVP